MVKNVFALLIALSLLIGQLEARKAPKR